MNPLKILKEAIQQLPALKYALGLLWLAAVIVIVVGFKVDLKIASFGVIVVAILMVELVLLARLGAENPGVFLLPVLVFLWISVGASSLTASFLLTSAFFSWPLDLKLVIHPEPQPNARLASTESDPQVVSILYATNRKQKLFGSSGSKFPEFSASLAEGVTLGSAHVRVPEHHFKGQIERPKLDLLHLSVFVLTFKTESDATDFILKNIQVLTKEEFVQVIRDSAATSALIYVHGFATSFEECLYRVAQLKWDTGYNGVPIAFSWPSDGVPGPIEYNHDRQLAEDSEDDLLGVLDLVQSKAQVQKIYVVAHSLGCQIVLDAIDKARRSGKNLSLGEIVFAAPDVPWQHFVRYGHVLPETAKGVTLYASSTDTALIASEGYSELLRAGTVTKDGPLMLQGIESIDISELGPNIFALNFNHNLVMSTRSALTDLGRILMTGTHPPDVRSPGEMRGFPEGIKPPSYWKVPQ